jgi:hypothetical protein
MPSVVAEVTASSTVSGSNLSWRNASGCEGDGEGGAIAPINRHDPV